MMGVCVCGGGGCEKFYLTRFHVVAYLLLDKHMRARTSTLRQRQTLSNPFHILVMHKHGTHIIHVTHNKLKLHYVRCWSTGDEVI